MSNLTNSSDLFVVLSNEQQELLTGGADFELSGSNYANKLSALRGAATSGPQGSTAVSLGGSNAINTAAQDFLGLGGVIPNNVNPLGNAPSFDQLGTGGAGGGAEQPAAAQTPATGQVPAQAEALGQGQPAAGQGQPATGQG
jgi:hypothetical protein